MARRRSWLCCRRKRKLLRLHFVRLVKNFIKNEDLRPRRMYVAYPPPPPPLSDSLSLTLS